MSGVAPAMGTYVGWTVLFRIIFPKEGFSLCVWVRCSRPWKIVLVECVDGTSRINSCLVVTIEEPDYMNFRGLLIL